MSNFGFSEANTFYLQLFEILNGQEEKAEEYRLNLPTAMEVIHDYLKSCYFLSINPLPELRRILPQFKWQFHRTEKGGKGIPPAGDIVEESDLIWMMDGGFHGSFALVTATSLDEKPRRSIFFAGRKMKVLGYELDSDEGKWAEAFAAKVVYA